MMDLTEFIATTTYFSFRGQLFKQKFGTAMGSQYPRSWLTSLWNGQNNRPSPLLPQTVNLSHGKKYVDDILEVINRGKVEALTGHLNGIDKKTTSNSRTNQRKMARSGFWTPLSPGGWIHQTTGLQESHTQRPVPVVSIASSTSVQTCCHTDVIGKE